MQVERILDHSSVLALNADMRAHEDHWLCFVKPPASASKLTVENALVCSLRRRFVRSWPTSQNNGITIVLDSLDNPQEQHRCLLDPVDGLRKDLYGLRKHSDSDRLGFVAVLKDEVVEDAGRIKRLPKVRQAPIEELADIVSGAPPVDIDELSGCCDFDHSSAPALVGALREYHHRPTRFQFIDEYGRRGSPWSLLRASEPFPSPEAKTVELTILSGSPLTINLTMNLSNGMLRADPFIHPSSAEVFDCDPALFAAASPWTGQRIAFAASKEAEPPSEPIDSEIDHSSPREVVNSVFRLVTGKQGEGCRDLPSNRNFRFCFVNDDGQDGPSWQMLGISVVAPNILWLQLITDQSKTVSAQLMVDDGKLRYWGSSTGHTVTPASFTNGVSVDDLRCLVYGNPTTVPGRIKYLGCDAAIPDNTPTVEVGDGQWTTGPDKKSNEVEWFVGITEPIGNSNARVGDCYLNTVTGDHFKKTDAATWATWTLQGNIGTTTRPATRATAINSTPDNSIPEPIDRAVRADGSEFCAVCDVLLWEQTGSLCRYCEAKNTPPPGKRLVTYDPASNEWTSAYIDGHDGCTLHTKHWKFNPAVSVKKSWPRWVGILALLVAMVAAYHADWIIERACDAGAAIRTELSASDLVSCAVCAARPAPEAICGADPPEGRVSLLPSKIFECSTCGFMNPHGADPPSGRVSNPPPQRPWPGMPLGTWIGVGVGVACMIGRFAASPTPVFS